MHPVLAVRSVNRYKESPINDYKYQIPTARIIVRHFYGLRFYPEFTGVHFLDPNSLPRARKETLCGKMVPDPQVEGCRVTRVDEKVCERNLWNYKVCFSCSTTARLIVTQAFQLVNSLTEEERVGPYGRALGYVLEFDRAFVRAIKNYA